ncbi:MAG: hypothetical protein IPN15_04050 [Saprospiraceae bacterium]|nr:hypothetical protein [Candidatus Vicinibacter affinis]
MKLIATLEISSFQIAVRVVISDILVHGWHLRRMHRKRSGFCNSQSTNEQPWTRHLIISHGDTLTICGDSLYLMFVETGFWIALGFGISTYSYSLDTSTKTFCIDIPSTSLNGNCKDVFVELSFKSVTNYILKATSNKINVCPENYAKYNITVTTGICQNNGTTNQLSDDYYYVKVILANFTNTNWTMERELNDPYPNETGKYIIKQDPEMGQLI